MKLFCKTNEKEYGTVGTSTNLTDSNGAALCVGDIVLVEHNGEKNRSKLGFVRYHEETNQAYIGEIGLFDTDDECFKYTLMVPHTYLSEGFKLYDTCYKA